MCDESVEKLLELVLIREDVDTSQVDGSKRGSVGQSEGLSIPRSSVRFRLKPDTSSSHEFELHRPSNKGTKLLLKVIKAIIIIFICMYTHIRVPRHLLHAITLFASKMNLTFFVKQTCHPTKSLCNP